MLRSGADLLYRVLIFSSISSMRQESPDFLVATMDFFYFHCFSMEPEMLEIRSQACRPASPTLVVVSAPVSAENGPSSAMVKFSENQHFLVEQETRSQFLSLQESFSPVPEELSASRVASLSSTTAKSSGSHYHSSEGPEVIVQKVQQSSRAAFSCPRLILSLIPPRAFRRVLEAYFLRCFKCLKRAAETGTAFLSFPFLRSSSFDKEWRVSVSSEKS